MDRRRAAILISVLTLSMPMTAHATEEVPYDVMVIAEELGERYGICPELLESIAYYESGFNPHAVGGGGRYQGIAQIDYITHAERMRRLGVTDLYDTYQCLLVAADYLHDLFDRYEDVGSVLMHYGGWGKRISSYEQTGKMPLYVKNVLSKSAQFERQNGK